MNEEVFTMYDEQGVEKEAKILTVIELNNSEYVVYSVEKNEEEDSIYVSKLITDELGEQKIEDIVDENEKQEVFKIVNEMIDSLEGE